MDFELVISGVKKLSDEEIVVTLNRIDAELSDLLSECLEFTVNGDYDTAGERMEQYFRIAKLRNFIRSLCPLKVPAKGSEKPIRIFPLKAEISQINCRKASQSVKSVTSSWELYDQGKKRV